MYTWQVCLSLSPLMITIFNLFKAPFSETVMSAALFGLSLLSVRYFGRFRQFSVKREKLLASQFNNPIPKQPHVTLVEPELKPRVIIVGDIHGCLNEFKSLLAACNYEPALTSVILVGDLVNKGPYSAQVVKFAREIGAYSVRGNHDDFALQYALKENRGLLPTKLSYINELSRYISKEYYKVSFCTSFVCFTNVNVSQRRHQLDEGNALHNFPSII